METSDALSSQNDAKVMTVQDWMITILIAAIPLVDIIMLFVWAFGDGANANKKNWAKAALIWTAIVIGLYVLLFMAFGAAFLSGMGEYS